MTGSATSLAALAAVPAAAVAAALGVVSAGGTPAAAGAAAAAVLAAGLGGWAVLGHRRRSEALRLLLDGQAEAVVAVDAAARVVSGNARARALFGPALTVGVPLSDLLPAAAEAESAAAVGVERNGVREVEGRAADGRLVPLDLAVALPAGPDGITILSLRDGRARRTAEDALRRKLRDLENNTRLLREIEHLAHIGCYDYFPATDEAQWSRELERIFGLEPAEDGEVRSIATFMARVHPDDLPAILEDAEDQTWKERERVFRIIRPDGAVRHVFSKGYREFGSDGRVTRLFGIDQDITDYIRAEAAVRESEETLRRIFEAAPVPMTVIDEAGVPLAVNRRALALFGVSEAEVPHLRAQDFYADPADRAMLIDALGRDGGVHAIDMELRTRAGTRIWVELSAARVSYSGRPAILTGFVDIDVRKRAEEALRAARDGLRHLLAAVPQPMMVLRMTDGRLLFCNAVAGALLDTTAEDAVGLGAVGFFHDAEDFDRTLSTLRRHRQLLGREVRLRDAPEGGERWALISAMAVTYEGEDAAMAVLTDISERHAAEQLLTVAKAQAEAAARAKSQFLTVMSHEIRTPMNGILGMVQLLSGSTLSDTQRDYVDTIRRSGENLLSLLADIQEVSRIEGGDLTFRPVDFAPRALLGRIVGLMEPSAMAKGLALEAVVEAGVPSVLCGDAARIGQVLFHLTSNAVKVTEQGGVRLRLRTLGAAPEGGLRVQFAVEDTGPGVPREARARLFDSFAQADGSTARRFGGAGLGLAICKGLVDAMGGRIGLDSAPGEGATFWVTLDLEEGRADPAVITDGAGGAAAAPGAPADAAPEPAQDPTRAKLAPAAGVAGKLHVLLVEDDKVNRMLAVELLRRAGHAVRAAADGVEGVAAVAEADPPLDVVLMDLHMPGIDGVEAIRRIRALPDATRAAVPVVVLTADVTAESAARARAAGADSLVLKPFRIEVLTRELTDLLGRPPLPLPLPAGHTSPAGAGAGAPTGQGAPATPPSGARPSGARRVAERAPVRPVLDPALVPPDSLILRQWTDLGPTAVTGLVDLFRETTPERMAALESALRDGDVAVVQDEAHALKGATGVLGLSPLHALFAEIEADAACEDLDACAETLRKARGLYDRTLAELATIGGAAAEA